MGNICSLKKEKKPCISMDNINLIKQNNNDNQILYKFNSILYINKKYKGNVDVIFYDDYLSITNKKYNYDFEKKISYYKIPKWKTSNTQKEKFWENDEINDKKKIINVYKCIIDFEPSIITSNILNIINKHMEFVDLY